MNPSSNLLEKSLDDFFRQDFRHLPAAKQHALIRSVGHLVCGMFDAGMPLPQLTLESFRINGESFAVTFHGADGMPLRLHGRPLSDRQRFVCLRHLCSRMLTGASRNQRFRFLQAVRGNRGRLRDVRPLVMRLEKAALLLARRHWRRQARLSLGSNARFEALRRGVWRTWSRRSEVAARLVEALQPDPGVCLRKGQSMGGHGSGCTSSKIMVGGHPYFVKRYYQPGWRYKIKYLLMRSKALATWYSSWQFHARGLPTALPLILMERRRFGFLQEAYLVYEFCEDARPLMGVWPQLAPEEKRNLIIRGAQLLGNVHLYGCIHGDSNWNNILLRDNGELLLVDLDCARTMAFFSYARAYRDLGHFIRDLRRKRNNGVEFLDFFITEWRRWLGQGNRVSRERHERIVRNNPGRKIDDCL